MRRRTPAPAGPSGRSLRRPPPSSRPDPPRAPQADARGSQGARLLKPRRQVDVRRPEFVDLCPVCLSLTRPLGNRLPRSPRPGWNCPGRPMGCVAGDPTSRGARPGGLPRTARHGARLCAVPQAGPVRFGTGPGSAVSTFHGPPKPHDARSASPDIALRTPPRPGRAPHELVRAA